MSELSCKQSEFLTRRRFLTGLGAGVVSISIMGCKRTFEREAQEFNLGEVKDLLYSNQHLRSQSLFVSRDSTGWSAMSTRCTYDGCDLTYQSENLLCMCCFSVYAHNGQVLRGPSRVPLSYYRMSYRDGYLYANTGEPVSPRERFTTPEIESAISGVKERLERETARPGTKIPDSLLGQRGSADKVEGMFKEQQDKPIPGLTEESIVPEPSPTPNLRPLFQ